MIEGFIKPRGIPPRIAKIRLGIKRQGQSGRDYPSDTDHFVMKDTPEVAKVYGDKPKSLVVMFASDDIEYNFPSRLEAWKGRQGADGSQRASLFCSSNGAIAHRIYVGNKDASGHAYVQSLPADERPEENDMFDMPCPYQECPYYSKGACKEVGRLNVVLPEVSLGGIYQIETSSAYGFINLLDMIDNRPSADDVNSPRGWAMKMTRNERFPMGHIAWTVPFLLQRVPQDVTFEGKVTKKHILRLMPIDDRDRLNKLQINVPYWMTGRNVFAAFGPATADHPEDLLPPVAQDELPALPPAPAERTVVMDDEPPPPPKVDQIAQWAKAAGVTVAQLEAIKMRCAGEESKIIAALKEKAAQRKPAPPAAKPAPTPVTQVQPPPPDEEPEPADPDSPLLNF